MPFEPRVRVVSALAFRFPPHCVRCDAASPTGVREVLALPRYVPRLPMSRGCVVPVCERCDAAFAIGRAKWLAGIGVVGALLLLSLAWSSAACLVLPFAFVPYAGFDRFYEARALGIRVWSEWSTNALSIWVANPSVRARLEEAARRPPRPSRA